VYQAVVNWLAPRVNARPQDIRVGRTFAGQPPAGYGQKRTEFRTMCDDLSKSLSQATGRVLTLSIPWRNKHQSDVLSDFMAAVAVELGAARMSPAGKKSLEWVLNK
jgi:hypothetical protein